MFVSCRGHTLGERRRNGLGREVSLTSMVSAHSRMCRWKVGVRLSKVTSPDFAVFSNNARCMFRGETGTLSIMRRVAPMRAAHLARFQIRKSLKLKCKAGWIASIHPELAFLRLLFCFFLPFVVMAQLRPSSVDSWRGREPIA